MSAEPRATKSAPFGVVTRGLPTIRFPGQYYDAETGLHYNHHRYYDPSIGRYVSGDPIGQLGGLNLYSYVFNDPTNMLDPTGLDPPVPHSDPRTFDDDRKAVADRVGQRAVDYAEGGVGGLMSCEIEFSSCRGESASNCFEDPTMEECTRQRDDCLRRRREKNTPPSATPEGDAARESGSRNAVDKYSRGRGKKVE